MSLFLGTTGGGSSLGFRSVGGGGIPGLDQNNPATGAKQIMDAGVTTNGYYWVKPDGYGGAAYPVYCILSGGTSNKHYGGGWTLAVSFRHGTNRPWHLGQNWGSNSTHCYYDSSNWGAFWTGGSVEGNSSGKPYSFQDQTEWQGNQDFSKDGRAIGLWQPMDDLMIMYHDSDVSINNPGATAWWTRNTSLAKQSLKDWWSTGETTWSTGGRQGMFDRGTLDEPQYNPDRGLKFTGDPVYMNTTNGNVSHSMSGYDLVFNVSTTSSTYKSNAEHNKSRLTNTQMANSVTGQDYPHVVNWGIGHYHKESSWSGAVLQTLGSSSYCDARMQQIPGGGNSNPDGGSGYSDNNQSGSSNWAYSSSCRNSSGNNSQLNTSMYGFTLWVRG